MRTRTLFSKGLAVLAALLVGTVAYPAASYAAEDGLSIAPSVVYSPEAGTSFNPEGGREAGTTYVKNIVLKNSGSVNGTMLVTYDQLVLEDGVQVYPIYRRSPGEEGWRRISTVRPSDQFSGLTRTAQPFLFEVPPGTSGLAAGTILLAGMIMPEDRSTSTLVVYSSSDQGRTWSLLSSIDHGGPAVYDPSPSSTTSTVWEPSLAVDAYGGLVAYFSDERQKDQGVLQAVVYRRSVDGGRTWGDVVNVSAPTNRSDRPGMITVTRMADGRYIAVYEVVNRPSQSSNNAVIYYKISDDGLSWVPETSIGTPIQLVDGRGIGSSPFVRWVPEGGPQGMVVVTSKWALDANGNIDGGQNYYVNRMNGEGAWERLPYAVTYDFADTAGGTFSGFAQSFDYDPASRALYQGTNVENLSTTYNDVVLGATPLNAVQYEAENARVTDAKEVMRGDASGGTKIGGINSAASSVIFDISVPVAGTYTLDVRYDNGTGRPSSHRLMVNGRANRTIRYAPTVDWGRFAWATTTVRLVAGNNTITLSKGMSFAEVDLIRVRDSSTDWPWYFHIVNKESGQLLEVASAATHDGASVGQWSRTGHRTQTWAMSAAGGEGSYQLVNVHSSKLLEIPGGAIEIGTQASQWGPTGHPTQWWNATAVDGRWRLSNANSGHVLEIADGSHEDGAPAQQWESNGYPCQEWVLVAEAAL
ncbi:MULTISPECIES: RICIN domain-containing protein [Actinomyces]|uniref:RICIN domain-containing protein n=1 Tax=Actinomyces respiraculi TaxID=2744574 RepID=A0A7T0PWZ1_9ACTO|nr:MULTISPECIES: RICIN domain-containing protein [Actinomyces]QPL05065.1 RICIN domain-containing protein [Actinomyces respiraculi]